MRVGEVFELNPEGLRRKQPQGELGEEHFQAEGRKGPDVLKIQRAQGRAV